MKKKGEEVEHICSTLGERIILILVIILLSFLSLIYFLWSLQIKKGDDFAERAQTRVIRLVHKIPVRGCMYSSDGKKLADNRIGYNLIFHIGEMRKGTKQKTIEFVLREAYNFGVRLRRPLPFYSRQQVVVELNPNETFEDFKKNSPEVYNSLARMIERHLYYHPVMPLTVYYDLTPPELAIVEELSNKHHGITIEPIYSRIYPLGIAAHVMGFTSNTRFEAEGNSKSYAYTISEIKGRDGLESFYNKDLAGQSGRQEIIVDILGYYEENYSQAIEPIHGNDLLLTIDSEMQTILEKQLVGKKGGCVVVDVKTGAIKAMASAPTFSLTKINQVEYYRQLSQDNQGPLINRAVGSFSPGSIIKPLGVAQALELGAVTEDLMNYCDGFTPIGRTKIRCSNRYGHGDLNAEEALACSCNDYMIDLVLKYGMTMEDFQQIYRFAGIGKRPNIDLPYATTGLAPSREWVKEKEHRNWTLFDTALITLGQGKVTLSPLHAALYTAAIANGGKIYRPYLVEMIKSPSGEIVSKKTPIVESILPISQENLDIVKRGMESAVNTSIGTARRIHNSIVNISGKTGSAQRGSGANRKVDSWFIGYAPSENPQYAICVFIQDGVGGGTDAAPIAGELFKECFQKLKDEENETLDN